MHSRPDSPPPRQPSPDLIPSPLSSPPRIVRGRVTSLKPIPRPHQQLSSSRSCDGLGQQQSPHNGGRHLINSRSYDNIRMRTDLQLSETSTIHRDSPVLPSSAKEHHISFRYPPRPSTATLPPVPPLPAYLRMLHDDSDTEKSSQLSCDSLPSLTGKESIRRCKSPPPSCMKRRLVSFTRIKLFSWGDSRSRSHAAAV